MTLSQRQFVSAAAWLCTVLAVGAISGCGASGTDHNDADPPASSEPISEPLNSDGPNQAVVVPVAMTPAPRPTGPLPPDAGCVTAECHATVSTARFVHGAVSPGDCTVCHEPDQGGHVYPLTRPGNAGCTFCHAVTENRIHQHAAIDAPGCTACHRPHTSDTKFLLTAPTVELLCAQCHITERRTKPHGPFAAGECLACHRPHESNHEKLLRAGSGPDHCSMCHAETALALANAPFVHEPAAESCTGCHDPHASEYGGALRQPIDETCFACHEDLEQTVAGATAPHAAVFTADRCANCHDPHASGRPDLLRNRQDVLCLKCHSEPILSASGRTIQDMTPILRERSFLHGPVRSGNCTACHNVHGASHSRLLQEHFTDAFYASFDLRNYALCFECHESDLATEPQTTTLTDFRNGDVNLHFTHVNRDRKGRSCRTCHAIHGSNLPKHVAETVPFEGSGWAMPIRFEKTNTGGSCAPGCHEPLSYNRMARTTPPQETPAGDGP
ncbi:MAG: cytochrome c3 family protein [Planctomycetota bacterium]|jgi:predicted CXXCH cytochrome family protein